MSGLVALLAAGLSFAQDPAADGPDEPAVLRRRAWSYPREAMALNLGRVRCLFEVSVGADGVPTEVSADPDCLEAFAAEGRDTLAEWRWERADAPWVARVGANFIVDSSAGPSVSKEQFEQVLAAYRAAPDEAPGCVVGMSLRRDLSLADLTSNHLPDCLAIPGGDLTWPDAVAAQSEATRCAVSFEVSRNNPSRVTFEEACPRSHRAFVRQLVYQWTWASPVSGTIPYQLVLAFEPATDPALPPGGCWVDGRAVADGAVVPVDCNSCRCTGGSVRCTLLDCSLRVHEVVTFAVGSAVVRPEDAAFLDALAATLESHPEVVVALRGVVATGEAPGLSGERAAAVRAELTRRGVAVERLPDADPASAVVSERPPAPEVRFEPCAR